MFSVILFKNKKKRKVLRTFMTQKNAKIYYNKLIKQSNDIIFNIEVENSEPSLYELALIGQASGHTTPSYLKDSFGRNLKIKLDDINMEIIEISEYRKEEKIFDLEKNRKITLNYFIRTYLSTDTLKVISILNNKIIVQKDENYKLFSVKNIDEAVRFIDCLSKHFFKIKRSDCLFVNDTSTPQKKYLIDLLSKSGFNKKTLYRQFTTTHKKKQEPD